MGNRVEREKAARLKLIETSWEEIKDKGIETVYIQSHANSDLYGPYVVVDSTEHTIARRDGAGGSRKYPRNKGLFRSLIADDVNKIQMELTKGVIDMFDRGFNKLDLNSLERRCKKELSEVDQKVKIAHELLHVKTRNVGFVAETLLAKITKEIADLETKLEKLYAQEELLKELLGTPPAPTRSQ
jgi:hypothetical protein